LEIRATFFIKSKGNDSWNRSSRESIESTKSEISDLKIKNEKLKKYIIEQDANF